MPENGCRKTLHLGIPGFAWRPQVIDIIASYHIGMDVAFSVQSSAQAIGMDSINSCATDDFMLCKGTTAKTRVQSISASTTTDKQGNA
ncbi:hypothetical protein [Accumulibacter sp.]|uniref:hypothetical protein n=1 Tax=Accumulibacter sp. TaxID=2053492 RepID=UPI0035B4AA19